METIYFLILIAIAIMVVIRFNKEQFLVEPKVLLFYKKDNKECHQFIPLWNKVSKNRDLKNTMIFSKIDVNDDQNKELLKYYKVHVYPSVFVNNKRVPRKNLSSVAQFMNHLNSFK